MAETNDFDPGPWKGADFNSARKAYAAHVDRSYADAAKANVNPTDLVPESISTDSISPLAIGLDGTGSMGEWATTIASKLPYLEIEAKESYMPDLAVSFFVIGDANSDRYGLQVQPFVKGTECKTAMEKLVIEKGGGGQTCESYELGALYYARNAQIPKATRPVLIFIGDEGFYEMINKEDAKNFCKVELKNDGSEDPDKDDGVVTKASTIPDVNRITTHKVFTELKLKWNVYIIRKPYSCTVDTTNEDNTRIQKAWIRMLGDDHVLSLGDPNRVVDVIFGILAKESGKIGYFEEELKDRQGKDSDGAAKIDTVMKSLKTIHAIPAKSMKKLPAGASVTRRSKAGGTSKSSGSLL